MKVTVAVGNPSNAHNSGNRPITHSNYTVCTHESESAHGMRNCDLNFMVERVALFKVTRILVHRKILGNGAKKRCNL